LYFRCVRCLIGIFDPIDGHICDLLARLYSYKPN
jgi:hypothetical protein